MEKKTISKEGGVTDDLNALLEDIGELMEATSNRDSFLTDTTIAAGEGDSDESEADRIIREETEIGEQIKEINAVHSSINADYAGERAERILRSILHSVDEIRVKSKSLLLPVLISRIMKLEKYARYFLSSGHEDSDAMGKLEIASQAASEITKIVHTEKMLPLSDAKREELEYIRLGMRKVDETRDMSVGYATEIFEKKQIMHIAKKHKRKLTHEDIVKEMEQGGFYRYAEDESKIVAYLKEYGCEGNTFISELGTIKNDTLLLQPLIGELIAETRRNKNKLIAHMDGTGFDVPLELWRHGFRIRSVLQENGEEKGFIGSYTANDSDL